MHYDLCNNKHFTLHLNKYKKVHDFDPSISSRDTNWPTKHIFKYLWSEVGDKLLCTEGKHKPFHPQKS